MKEKKLGTLYLCATPIGNLEDISLRALRVLRETDFVAAESLTRAKKLLNYYDIHKPLIRYREDKRETSGRFIIELLKKGKSVALVSDAGMPGVSDPGLDVIRLCRKENLPLVCIPGASAATMAVVLSGFSTSRFVFEGFLPRKKTKRSEILQNLINEQRTVVIFESPHRLRKTLIELREYIPSRKICIQRELTKLFEEILWGTPCELLQKFDKTDEIKGEITIVIEGTETEQYQDVSNESTILEEISSLMKKGFKLREAVIEVAKTYRIPYRKIYKKAIKEKKGRLQESS